MTQQLKHEVNAGEATVCVSDADISYMATIALETGAHSFCFDDIQEPLEDEGRLAIPEMAKLEADADISRMATIALETGVHSSRFNDVQEPLESEDRLTIPEKEELGAWYGQAKCLATITAAIGLACGLYFLYKKLCVKDTNQVEDSLSLMPSKPSGKKAMTLEEMVAMKVYDEQQNNKDQGILGVDDSHNIMTARNIEKIVALKAFVEDPSNKGRLHMYDDLAMKVFEEWQRDIYDGLAMKIFEESQSNTDQGILGVDDSHNIMGAAGATQVDDGVPLTV
jgi:hypothetical protein